MSLLICPSKQNKTKHKTNKPPNQTKQHTLISFGNSLESMSWLKPATEVENTYLGFFFPRAVAYQRPFLHQRLAIL